MARKRARKKQQKHRDGLADRLGELERRGADEEFLKLAAAELEDPTAGPLGARWAEVADRALAGALAAGDLDRLTKLLPSMGPAGRRPPLAKLAAAVVDLAAGRLDAGRAKLEALATAGGLEPGRGRELVPRLLALAAGDGRTRGAPAGDLREIGRLRELADETAGAAAAALPPAGRIRLRHPLLRAARDFLLALRRLEAAEHRVGGGAGQALGLALRRLREAPDSGDAAVGRLLDGAERLLALLGALDRIEKELARAHPEESASRILLDELRRPGGALARALATALAEPAPPLLAPLGHAVHLAWRGVLETVMAKEGAEGLATVAAARPELVEPEADLPTGAAGKALHEARRARTLLADGRLEELTGLLRARARTESQASDLAALWSLELWARGQAEPIEDYDALFGDEPVESPPHAAVVRIEEMAAQIGRRFPAEQRGEVARVLRDELLDLCELVAFCEHFAGAAAALLDHLPGDAGLLIAGLTGAIAGGDLRCRRALEGHLERRGAIQPFERETALRVMAQVALEDPACLAPALEALRPLFAETDWSEVSEGVARRAAPAFGALLVEAPGLPWLGPQTAAEGCKLVRQELEPLRATLGATSGFSAVELALDCWRPKAAEARKKVRTFLGAESGYETALLAVEVLEPTLEPSMPEGALAALRDLSEAVIDRLDDRWQRWWRAVPILALSASSARLRKLAKRIERLLATELDGPAQRTLEGALEAVDTVENARRALGRRGPAPRRKSRPRRRRPATEKAASATPGDGRGKRRRDEPEAAQLDLDLG